VAGSSDTSNGNISTDPLFNGTWGLGAASPAINAGSTDLLPMDSWDMDTDGDDGEPLPFDHAGSPRVVGASVDMGAFEVQP